MRLPSDMSRLKARGLSDKRLDYVHRPSRPARLFGPFHDYVWVDGLVGQKRRQFRVLMRHKRLLLNLLAVYKRYGGKPKVWRQARLRGAQRLRYLKELRRFLWERGENGLSQRVKPRRGYDYHAERLALARV